MCMRAPWGTMKAPHWRGKEDDDRAEGLLRILQLKPVRSLVSSVSRVFIQHERLCGQVAHASTSGAPPSLHTGVERKWGQGIRRLTSLFEAKRWLPQTRATSSTTATYCAPASLKPMSLMATCTVTHARTQPRCT